MLKKILPVALVGLLGGCAAFQEAQSLQNSLQTFLVRSITMNAPGVGEQCKVALIWGGTSALKTLKRGATDVNVDKTKNFGEETVTADGSNYTYTATFENAKEIVRQIQPYTVGDAGTVQATSPDALPLDTVARTGLKLKWKMTDTANPTGFMVTVGEAADPTNPANITPVYNAFLQAASHSVGTNAYEIAYGAPSDLSLLTKEITDLMKGMDPRFAKKDEGISADQLDPAKTYIWLVSPLKIDDKAIRFAIGASDFSAFKVTP